MGSLLDFLEIRLASNLSNGTFIFATWSVLLIVEYWIIGRGWGQLERSILFYLEIKLLNLIKVHQVIEIYHWLSIDFFHK